MAMKACKECKKEISTDANPCPHCGKKNPHGSSKILVFGGVLGVAAVWALSGGAQKQAATQMKNIENQVATDAVAQYEIAKRNGDLMQTCVQAGMVSAAFLQAKDEASYGKWKTIEKDDCAKAGVPK
jgi:predicted amidophosphoribosyltransferase